MGNYIVEDEIEYDSTPREEFKRPKRIRNYIIIGIVLVIILFIIIILSSANKLDKYEKIEKEMREKAKDYVLNKANLNNTEIYIEVSKLKVEIPDECSLLSGVFYNEGSYEPYLICPGHKSKIGSNNRIDLIGEEIIFLKKSNEY